MFEWLLPNDIEMQLGNETYMENQVKGMKNKESREVYEGLKRMGFAGNGKTSETVRLTKDIRQLYALHA